MRKLAITVFVLALGIGIYALRAATMSVHEDIPSASSLSVWLSADTLVAADPGARLARSQVDLCAAEAVPFSDITAFGPADGVDDPAGDLPVFRLVLEPGADAPDRAQLRGCLEDLRVRHLRLNVLGQRQVVRGDTTVQTGSTP